LEAFIILKNFALALPLLLLTLFFIGSKAHDFEGDIISQANTPINQAKDRTLKHQTKVTNKHVSPLNFYSKQLQRILVELSQTSDQSEAKRQLKNRYMAVLDKLELHIKATSASHEQYQFLQIARNNFPEIVEN